MNRSFLLFLAVCLLGVSAAAFFGNVLSVTASTRHAQLQISTTSLPSGIVGSPYSARLAATGGTISLHLVTDERHAPIGSGAERFDRRHCRITDHRCQRDSVARRKANL